MKYLDRYIREEDEVGFNIEKHRLRCFVYEMQIVVKGLLFESKIKDLETYAAIVNVSEKEKAK